ncbi:MAG: transketolase [Bacteroidetes bacterium]|nr:transketolase [Bacteroidota bacterium]MCL5738734.1 transketolase [Bacteroidota bacterium]
MTKLEELCVNTIRFLSVDAVEKANSGHPGMPMGTAPIGFILWTKFLKHNPRNPKWFDRDRFVLSAGHGSMLLYSLLHLTGYDVSIEDIKNFRQFGSITPGHPEYGLTPGVETTTGPLGQGLGNAVGMAIAEAYLAAHFNRDGFNIVDHFTYVIAGDGDMMEGITSEASSLAGHLKLGKLVVFYDDNHITIEGKTDLAFSEDVLARYSTYGWHTQRVADGNDIEAITKAIETAKGITDKPSIIGVRTHIGYGSPDKQDSAEAHGSPLGEKEVELTKKNLGWPLEPKFLIPDEALAFFRKAIENGRKFEEQWNQLLLDYQKKYPELVKEFSSWLFGEIPSDALKYFPRFDPAVGAVATRSASGKVINAFAPKVKNFLGGAADLSPSTDTLMKDTTSFSATDRQGRNFHFGIREHGMGAILNGMSVHGGLIPFGATFFVFSDYMRPPIRLASLSHFRTIYVFTHDSIGLGEDGPTHQPVEHLMALRAIPDFVLIRPGDANETAEAWKFILGYNKGPAAIILTRQKLSVIDRSKYASEAGLQRGAYVLAESGNPDAIIIATGSEVSVALKAYEELASKGKKVRLVSMPSWEIFDIQDKKYRESILPSTVWRRVSIEAGITKGWCRYVGDRGLSIGVDRFGSSAPGDVVVKEYGITSEAVVSAVEKLLK